MATTKVHLSGTILIIAVFIVDCVTGLWQKIIGTPDPVTMEEWGYQMLDMLANKSWFTYVPYLLLAMIMLFRFWPKLLKCINFDILDAALLAIYTVSCVITSIDYHSNLNMRDWTTDAYSYAIATCFILMIKITIKSYSAWKNWRKNM